MSQLLSPQTSYMCLVYYFFWKFLLLIVSLNRWLQYDLSACLTLVLDFYYHHLKKVQPATNCSISTDRIRPFSSVSFCCKKLYRSCWYPNYNKLCFIYHRCDGSWNSAHCILNWWARPVDSPSTYNADMCDTWHEFLTWDRGITLKEEVKKDHI